MRRAAMTRPAAGWLIGATATGFLAGILVMAVARGAPAPMPDRALIAAPGAAPVARADPSVAAPVPPSVAAPVTATPTIGADPREDLRKRRLELPVQGLKRDDLRVTFDEMRGGARRHEALDILAERNTPVLAVEDGRVAKLFVSNAGGLTVYQFDPTSTYAYYYAHLERYADGLKDGDRVERGQVIGYVGTSGNAPRDTPHLHFAIFQLADAQHWWRGTAIDPYPILK
jgi:murein DD-endopeptidase MepM/ murein hydrolase activator NlpD